MTHRRTSWLLVAAVTTAVTSSAMAETRIAYSPNQTALSIFDQPAGTITPVPTSGFGGQIVNSPNWSPDGQWLAFHAGPSGSARIYKIHPDGTGQQAIGPAAGDIVDPDFSPDGSKILYQGSGRQLFTMNADGSSIASLPAYGVGGRWSPNGAKLAYGGQPSPDNGPVKHNLYLFDMTAMTPSTLVTLPGTDSISSVAWSPDGTKIAAGIGDNAGTSRIDIIDAASGAVLSNLTAGFSLYGSVHLDWSPAGDKIYFTGNHTGNFDLWDVNAVGSPTFADLTNTPGVNEWVPSVIPEPTSAGCVLLILTATAIRRRHAP